MGWLCSRRLPVMKLFRLGQQKLYWMYALVKTSASFAKASRCGVGTWLPYAPSSGRRSSMAMNSTDLALGGAGPGGGVGGGGGVGRMVPPLVQLPGWGWIARPSLR